MSGWYYDIHSMKQLNPETEGPDRIWNDNLKEWLAWAFFASDSWEAVEQRHKSELRKMVHKISVAFNIELKPGYNDTIK